MDQTFLVSVNFPCNYDQVGSTAWDINCCSGYSTDDVQAHFISFHHKFIQFWLQDAASIQRETKWNYDMLSGMPMDHSDNMW